MSVFIPIRRTHNVVAIRQSNHPIFANKISRRRAYEGIATGNHAYAAVEPIPPGYGTRISSCQRRVVPFAVGYYIMTIFQGRYPIVANEVIGRGTDEGIRAGHHGIRATDEASLRIAPCYSPCS